MRRSIGGSSAAGPRNAGRGVVAGSKGRILGQRMAYQSLVAKKDWELRQKVTGEEKTDSFDTKDVLVVSRVRPMFPEEKEHNFGIVSAFGTSKCYLHAPKPALAGEPSINTTSFKVDRAFGATHNNDDVYNAIGRPLVNLAARGGTSTLIAYGQTGTGKTYTITGLLQRIGEDLFKELGPGDAVELRVVEILGANATDLMHSVPGAKYVKPEGDEEEKADKPVRTTKALAEKERRVKAKLAAKAAPPPKNAVFIREDRFSNLQLANARSLVVQDSRHFLGAVQLAFQGRSTAATLKNDTSSRSHACVCLRIISGDRELQQQGQASEGRLYIVDLAGSERASDTSHHDAARLKETKEINKSLMTLKDCIKARSSGGQSASGGHLHIPYRYSLLTYLLKDSFELAVLRPVKTAFIACVSPLGTDSSHSTNTMRYAQALVGTPPTKVIEKDAKDPTTWSHEKACAWLVKMSKGAVLAEHLLPSPTDNGAVLASMPQQEFIKRAMMNGKLTAEQAERLYVRLWQRVADARTRKRQQVMAVRSSKPSIGESASTPRL